MKYSEANKYIFQASALATAITVSLSAPAMANKYIIDGIESEIIDGSMASNANAISGDGTVILSSSGKILTLAGGNWLTALSVNGEARSISGDNSAIVGSTNDKRAVVWFGNGWSQQSYLGEIDGTTSSVANDVSKDGKLAVGTSTGGMKTTATLWRVSLSGTTTVKNLSDSNTESSAANAISSDGSVVTGQSGDTAVIWTGADWNLTKLGTLKADDSGQSSGSAISENGSVIVGYSSHDGAAKDNQFHATVWNNSGTTVSKGIDLGTIKADNSGTSQANGISADGLVVVGVASNEISEFGHAVLWLNAEGTWSKGIDLDGSSGYSAATSISDDKTVVAGKSGTSSLANTQHAMLWKLNWKEEAPETPEVAKGVDATNTVTTIGQLAGDTFAAMELQRQGLIRLQDGCTTSAQGEACGQVRAGIISQGDQRDTATGFSIAYGAADNLSIGVSLDRSLSRSLPSSYQKNNNNIGGGLYAQWNNPFDAQDWFIRGAASFNQYSVDVIRPTLSNTEAGTGSSKMKGAAFTLETGQNFSRQDGRIAGWNAGVRHSNVTRDGYTEGNAEFPVTYGSVDYGMTSAFLGGIYVHPLTADVKLVTRAQIEQDLATNDAEYKASASYIGGFVQKADMTKTRGLLAAGPSWDITKDMQASLMPYVGNSALGDTTWGADLRLTARF